MACREVGKGGGMSWLASAQGTVGAECGEHGGRARAFRKSSVSSPINAKTSQSIAIMRNPVACVSCRSAKQKCVHQDRPPCDRCREGGRAEQCHFPAPGTSAIHRKPKRPRPSEDAADTPATNTPNISAVAANQGLFRRNDAALPNGLGPTYAATHALSPVAASSPSALLDGLDPFDLLTDEVKNSYLRCSYKWSFHHTPTLLRRIRDRNLEPWMAWAMLALAIRYACHYIRGRNQSSDICQIRERPSCALQVAD